jgi:hypothetical protein
VAADDDHQVTTGTEVAPTTGAEVARTEFPHLRPEDWGWHHEFTTGRQVAGWLCVIVLGLFLTSTHYNNAGSLAILLIMLAMIGGLIWDRHRRRTLWRS